MRKIFLLAVATVTIITTGCSAIQNRQLQIDSKMSKTVFLNPDKTGEGTTIYTRFANTSTYQDSDLAKLLKTKLEARGYRVVKNAKDAVFTLQANMLYIGEETETMTMEGALLGGAVGAGTGLATKGGTAGTLLGAGAGAGLGALLGTFGGVDTIIGVIDILISERTGTDLSDVAQTRIVVRAKQANMDKNAAKALVADKIVAQVAGTF